MAGYSGYSMSNNAVSAYNNGEMPMSKWTKGEIIKGVESYQKDNDVKLSFEIDTLKKLAVKDLKDMILYKSSWHHTSMHFNNTDFYSIDTDKLDELTEKELVQTIEERKAAAKEIKGKIIEEPVTETWKCAYLEWSGSRNHPKADRIEAEGVIKGNWFHLKDGSKKSINANGFEKLERIIQPGELKVSPEEIKKYGFKPTKRIINNMEKLNEMRKTKVSLEEIQKMYKMGNIPVKETKVVANIVDACKQQELALGCER